MIYLLTIFLWMCFTARVESYWDVKNQNHLEMNRTNLLLHNSIPVLMVTKFRLIYHWINLNSNFPYYLSIWDERHWIILIPNAHYIIWLYLNLVLYVDSLLYTNPILWIQSTAFFRIKMSLEVSKNIFSLSSNKNP